MFQVVRTGGASGWHPGAMLVSVLVGAVGAGVPTTPLLFIVGANGGIRTATDHRMPEVRDGDTVIELVPPG
jgi:hypothetical protein